LLKARDSVGIQPHRETKCLRPLSIIPPIQQQETPDQGLRYLLRLPRSAISTGAARRFRAPVPRHQRTKRRESQSPRTRHRSDAKCEVARQAPLHLASARSVGVVLGDCAPAGDTQARNLFKNQSQDATIRSDNKEARHACQRVALYLLVPLLAVQPVVDLVPRLLL
jgi:hypothetical protein